jgi:hypothetical protein
MSGRAIVPVTVAACLALIPVEFGWAPWLRHAWALDLWQYLPEWLSALLALSLLALCVARVRERIAHTARAALALGGDRLTTRLSWLALLALPVVFWLLRERRLYGDSGILLFNAAAGSLFLFPDIGATYLFQLCHRLAASQNWHVQDVAQAAVALAGGATVACFLQVGRHLASSPARGVLTTALILSGGVLRVLSGHVEVYAFLLVCAGGYLWSALAYLHGRASFLWPAVAAGIGVWMHLSAIFLLPSLVALLALGPPPHARSLPWARVATGLLVAAAPTALFLDSMWILGRDAELEQAWQTMLRWTGVEPSPFGHEAFLRGWLSGPGQGTRYVILSVPHLKYLANAFFLLIPSAFPIALGFAFLSPRRLVATPEAIVLSTASLSLLVYAGVVRPVWGPYDWDLFGLTAAVVATLAMYLVMQTLDGTTLMHFGVLTAGAALLLVTIPFIAIGIAPAHSVGPFAIDLVAQPSETPIDALERLIGAWL